MTVGSTTRHLIFFALAAVGSTGSITFLFFALCNGIVEVVGRFTVPILFTKYLGMGATGIWVSAGIVWAISGITAWMRLMATRVLYRESVHF